MYYGLIILTVIMFGVGFGITDGYRKKRGSSLLASMHYSLISSIAGLIIFFLINGFKFEFTLFTFILALISSIKGFGFTYCAFKSLNMTNLSMFSLYSMLGGMLLPFLQGLIFYGEKFTIAKITCLLFITASLLMTVKKGKKAKGYIFYVGVFILNGLSGVLSKIFASAPAEIKTSPAGYSQWGCILSIVIALIFTLLPQNIKKIKDLYKGIWYGASYGAINRTANWILVLALAHVDASAQYPMVTGGVIIVSTIISIIKKNIPSKKEIIAVILAFLGMLALILPF